MEIGWSQYPISARRLSVRWKTFCSLSILHVLNLPCDSKLWHRYWFILHVASRTFNKPTIEKHVSLWIMAIYSSVMTSMLLMVKSLPEGMYMKEKLGNLQTLRPNKANTMTFLISIIFPELCKKTWASPGWASSHHHEHHVEWLSKVTGKVATKTWKERNVGTHAVKQYKLTIILMMIKSAQNFVISVIINVKRFS